MDGMRSGSGSSFVIVAVCLGNICRSPMAEAVLQSQFEDAGVADKVTVTSAGTAGWHAGETADPRAAATLTARGYRSAHRAQQFQAAWFDSCDLVLAMDSANYADLALLRNSGGADLTMIRSFDPALAHLPVPHPQLDVPDPYYGGQDGFAAVLDMLEVAGAGVVRHVMSRQLS